MTRRTSLPTLLRMLPASEGKHAVAFDGAGTIQATAAFAPIGSNVGILSAGPDSILGTIGADTLNGEAGNDTLNGLDGNDVINGNTDNDSLLGGNGLDTLHGGAGNDVLVGGADNDHLNGGTGSDSLYGGTGNDFLDAAGPSAYGLEDYTLDTGSINRLFGEAGNDSLWGMEGNDVLNGGADNDSMNGEAGQDTLLGGAGNDTLEGQTGDDVIDGGDGDDVIGMNNAQGDTITGGAGADRFVYSAGIFSNYNPNFFNRHVISDFDAAEGDRIDTGVTDGTFNEYYYSVWNGDAAAGFTASIGQSVALAGETDGMIAEFWRVYDAANDVTILFVDRDQDGFVSAYDLRLEFTGNVALDANSFVPGTFLSSAATNGADALVLTTGNDVLLALGGDDTIDGLAGSDTLYGNAGNDRLTGNLDADYLRGGTGNDWQSGGAGNDNVYGDDGADSLYGGDGFDLLDAGNNDASGVINFLFGGTGYDTLYGHGGEDRMYGEGDNDYLNGDDGNDFLDGGDGLDTLNGGEGDDNVNGGNGNDSMAGNEGADTMRGGAGNDTIRGASDTTFVPAIVDAANRLFGDAGSDTIVGGSAGDYIDGGTEYDSLYGADGNDTVLGGSGVTTDDVRGGNGDDYLDGGAGADWMFGGAGNDRVLYDVNDVGEQISVLGGEGSDTLVMAIGASVDLAALDQVAGGGITSEFENIDATAVTTAMTMSGNDVANHFIGGSANDTLYGLAGNDTLDGRGGSDRLIGGEGDDTYVVNLAGDTVVETIPDALGGIDTVLSTLGSYALTANVENLRLVGTGAQNGTGNIRDNVIYASTGSNLLDGGYGNDTVSYAYATGGVNVTLATPGAAQATGGSGFDTLARIENVEGSQFADTLTGNNYGNRIGGLAGSDTLVGGHGIDTFVFTESDVSTGSMDTIADFFFAGATDRIDLSAIDANTALVGDQAFAFVGGAAFGADATGQLRYEAGVLYGSIDADSDAEFAVALTGMPALFAADFVL